MTNEAPASSFLPSAANAHNVFDGMSTSLNDETYMTTMGVGSNNWSQTNDVHLDDHEFEVDEYGEGEDKKTKKGKIGKERPFTLPHCYDELKDDEKWKPREGVDEESNTRKCTIDLDDDEEESSSDGGKRSPTPNSVAYSKPNRPSGGRKEGKEKKNRKGDDELKMIWKLL
ncbi:UDP-glycosyltransferase 73C6 [Hordeum vulgare]|nr:UDP-glycosyltransferase 73C6 [Hordeum vulgare]